MMVKYRKFTALMCITAVAASALSGCSKQNKPAELSAVNQQELDDMDSAITELGASSLIRHSDEDGKEETVYVIMDANGANASTIVSEWLKNPQGSGTLNDSSTLENIEVVKGAARLISDEKGALEWNTAGEDVYYRGTTDKELPVAVNISCTLDGKPIAASELVNVTGHVKIDYNYDNKIYKVMNIGDETCNIYQPFTTITGLLLDDETAANIKVTDGKVIDSGTYSIVFGIAMPGLKESLGLDELETDKDISIPESVSIEADVTNFSMPMSMTVVSNTALSALNIDNINSVDELKDKVAELTDGMDQLIDGSGKLDDGMNELAEGTQKLQDGVTELDDGVVKLDDGAKELLNGAGELKNGAGQLYEGTGSLHDGSKKLADGLGELNAKTPELASGVQQLKSGAESLSAGIGQLDGGSAGLNSGAAQVAGGLSQLSAGIDTFETAVGGSAQQSEGAMQLLGALKAANPSYAAQLDGVIALIGGYNTLINGDGTEANPGMKNSVSALAAGATQLKGGVEQYTGGVSQIKAGAEQLSAGTAKLNDSVPALASGVTQLADGAKALESGAYALKDGAYKLYDGTGKLTDGVSELSDGTGKLKDGTGELNDGVVELNDGVAQLTDGSGKLADGIIKFNDEGISKITDLVNNDLDAYYDRLCAIRDFANEYTSFTGTDKSEGNSVKFIYKTNAAE